MDVRATLVTNVAECVEPQYRLTTTGQPPGLGAPTRPSPGGSRRRPRRSTRACRSAPTTSASTTTAARARTSIRRLRQHPPARAVGDASCCRRPRPARRPGTRVLPMSRLATRLRSEGGFTLPEMLTGIIIAMIVSLATFALIEFTMRRTGEIQGRVEASPARPRRDGHDDAAAALAGLPELSSCPRVGAARASRLGDASTSTSPTADTDRPRPSCTSFRTYARRAGDRGEATIGQGGRRRARPIVFPALPTRDARRCSRTRCPTATPGAPADLPVFRYYAFNAATPPRGDARAPAPLSPNRPRPRGRGSRSPSAPCRRTRGRTRAARSCCRTRSTSDRPTPTPRHPHPHAHEPPPPHGARRARPLDVRRHHGDARHVAVRRRRLRRGQRRPADVRRLQGPQGTYAAAEAGLNFYAYHLTQDNDYWTKCDAVPAPNASEPNPVNQPWNGTGADPRRWRNVPGSTAQYTVELLPARNYTQCIPGPTRSSLIDLPTGTFRLRFTGRPRPDSTPEAQRRRDVPARRLPELPLLHRLRGPRPAGLRDLRASAPRPRPTAPIRYRAARAEHDLHGDPLRHRGPPQRAVPLQRRHPALRLADLRP